MQQSSVEDLIRTYFAAFLAQDRQALEESLSEDFTFTSPYDDHISKAEFFERCLPGSENFRRVEIERIFVSGNEAFMRYQAELKDGSTFRNTEFIRVEGDKLRDVEVYFGSR
jgi:ketosteroid isomerase-like protein